MKRISQDLLITLFGIITSLITATVLAWVEYTMNFEFYSITYWVIIPIGAIASGFFATSGYYLGAVLFHHKPSKLILLNMVLISLGTYFLIQYLSYIYLKFDGEQISNLISFWQYLDFLASNSAIKLMSSSKENAINLGSWGYLYELIQIIGFSLGGFSLFGYLISRMFCDKCSRYYFNKGSSERYSNNGEILYNVIMKIASLIEADKFAEAIQVHKTEAGDEKFNNKSHHLRIKLILMFCKDCSTNCLCIETSKNNGKDSWDTIDDLSFNVITRNQLSLT